MAESPTNPFAAPLPDGIVPAEVVARTEKRWIKMMAAMLLIMLVVIVATGIAGAMHPPSNVEAAAPRYRPEHP